MSENEKKKKILKEQSKEHKLFTESNKSLEANSEDKNFIFNKKISFRDTKNVFGFDINKISNNLLHSNIPQAIKQSFFNKSKITIEYYPKAKGRFSEIYEGIQGSKKFAIKMVR